MKMLVPMAEASQLQQRRLSDSSQTQGKRELLCLKDVIVGFFGGRRIARERGGGMWGGQCYLPQSLSTIFVFWTDWILGPLANCLGWLDSKSQESSCLCLQSIEYLDDRCGLGIQTQFLMLAFYQAELSFPCLLMFLSCYFWCCWGMNTCGR